MVLVREDVAEAAGVDPSHLKQSLAVACIYAGQPHLGVIPIRRATEEALRDRLALEVRLLDDAVGIPKEDVLSEYEVEGQDYVIIVSPLNQGVDQLE
ncbi:MAG: hypothetical protein PF636_05600 [Actinomycetota bacterium]|jgi:hypothetical protein|nr:hypothetical protein [Actinomycetota bacterium]